MTISFTINGIRYNVDSTQVSLETSLNSFIRENAELFGTKFMCLEGGCGACIVTVRGHHPITNQPTVFAVNSCLFPVYSCHNLDITTIEGIGNRKDGYHQIQKRLADFNGSQCGFCSPGVVMNMHSLLESDNQLTMEKVENSFGGNICRCTGYRSILDAFKSLAINADEKLLTDIEDAPKKCPKSGLICANECKKDILHLQIDNNDWHKVYNLEHVFAILITILNRPYMLVSGNTAHGVYRRDPNIEVFIDITSVADLHAYKIGAEIEIGASVSITETMAILTKAANLNSNFEYCFELVRHIDKIGNVPVRNVATIAGNLTIKHQHNEFPSDLFLLLETIGAKLVIAQYRFIFTIVSPQDFLKLDMNKKVICKIILPPLPISKYVLRTYKVAPRAQNSHAYVNAGFLYEFSRNKQNLRSATICFGGINPKFVHAYKTQNLLIGKDLYTNDTLQQALASLDREINPDWILPDSSPQFRKNLALSLFYKSVLNTAPIQKVNPKYKTGGEILERPLSSGTQSFDTNKNVYPVTENVKKLEADIQSSGEASYVNDIPRQPFELYAAFVLATKVHSKIIGFETREALKIPGVHAFFSAKDIPGKNDFSPRPMLFLVAAEEILCSGNVLFNGQPAGIIVADNFEIANRASSFVQIIYEAKSKIKKILPTLSDVLENKETNRILEVPMCNKKATMYGAPQQSKFKISERFELGSQYHLTMETQCCVCIPKDDVLNVYSATQWIDVCQVAISQCLNIPEHKIDMKVRRLGGAYGAKISRSSQIACACALAAHLLNRPIRFIMQLEANMLAIGKRAACVNDYDVEFDENGKIQKLKNVYYEDRGCSMNEAVEFFTAPAFLNVYENAGWDVTSNAVLTDAPSTTWTRAPGTLEGIFMIENIMEHISKVTGKSQYAVRLNNMTNNHPMRKMMTDFIVSSDFDKRKAEIDDFNSKNRWKKRGLGLAPMSFFIIHFGSIPVQVQIYQFDGTVAVTHGGIEMGQGINTKAAQVAAKYLGISLEMISVKPSNNLSVGNATITGGSVTSEVVCFAVMKACEKLNANLKPVRDAMPKLTWPELTKAAYERNIELSTLYYYKASDLKDYYVYGISCAEVEIDVLTGSVLVQRVDILEDVGNSLSPGIDVGQVEGAFVMGLGYILTENLVYDRQNGELLTTRTWNYKAPGAKDIPIDFRVSFLKNSTNPVGVLGSKATGEPAITMSCCILFALRHALDSARKDSGLNEKEWYHLSAPSTTEVINLIAENSFGQFKLN